MSVIYPVRTGGRAGAKVSLREWLMGLTAKQKPFLTEVLPPAAAVTRLRGVSARVLAQSGGRRTYRSSAGWIVESGVGRDVRLEFYSKCPSCH